MKNSNLISTVIYAQVLLIFISFKIPDNLSKRRAINTAENKTENSTTIVEKTDIGTVEGVTYNFNYPVLFSAKNQVHQGFEAVITKKIKEGKLEVGFGILDETLCHVPSDQLKITNQYVDFKIYKQNNAFTSLLLMKGDYIDNNPYPEYSFFSVNYDFENNKLLEFEDVFDLNHKKQLVDLMNTRINKLGNCNPISIRVFENYKNNFVIKDDSIKFYFDECVMCKDHHREYAIEIPLSSIKSNMIITSLLK